MGNLLIQEEFKSLGRWKVRCLCDCGTECVKLKQHVQSGRTASCGCLKNVCGPKNKRKWTGFGEISGDYWSSLKRGAKARGLVFDVSINYGWDLFLEQNRMCKISGEPLKFVTSYRKQDYAQQTASLDRIDSNYGYIKGNLCWLHKTVNKMKSNLKNDLFIEWCTKCSIGKKTTPIIRPTFDEYFLNLAFNVSLRSDDPDIRHGAIIVNNQNHIIGTGYNATIKGSDPNIIPYNTRDKKRLWMIHAEENAMLNCLVNPNNIGGAKIYVTGKPCVNCLQRLVNFGISEIFYAKRAGTITENSETEEMRQDIINMSGILVTELDLTTPLLGQFR